MPVSLFVSLIFFSRLISLFSFAPLLSEILSFYSSQELNNPLLLSLLGSSYGLMQALFQYPWARLSDFVPRISLIRALLGLFSFSSLGCYFSTSIYSLIFFRALQGSCALQGLLLAYLSDHYSGPALKKAMLFVGLAVALSLFIGYGAPFLCTNLSLEPAIFFLLSFTFFLFLIFSCEWHFDLFD